MHFECNNLDQLEESKLNDQQSLHGEKQYPDGDEPHVVDRRNDGLPKRKTTRAFESKSERDIDYLKQDDGEEFFVMKPSEGENIHQKEKDEEDFHLHLAPLSHPPTYQVVPIKGHEYRDQRYLESMLSPHLKSKPTRVSKKLTPCQKAASLRRNDRKSKRFERSVKCTE